MKNFILKFKFVFWNKRVAYALLFFGFINFNIYALAQDGNDSFKLGMIFYNQGKYQQAIDEFTKSLKKDYKYADAYKFRAFSYEKLNELNRATKDLNYYIKLNPYNFDSYITRGQFMMRMGEEEQALDDFNKALFLNPDYTFGYFYRGSCYKVLGDTNACIRDYLKFETVYPNHLKLLDELSHLYFLTGEYILSIEYCTRYLNLKNDDAELYLIRGKSFAALHKINESCKDFLLAANMGNKEAMDLSNACSK